MICAPTPGRRGQPARPARRAARRRRHVYRIGGAQAIAALAYGTETIAPVDKITGPGNALVAAAKRRVFGRVGIDMIAGPSEVLVLADADNDPDWLALDLLAQAEHDASAQSILVTDDARFGRTVARGGGAARHARAARDRRRELARPWRGHHRARLERGDARSPTASRRASGDLHGDAEGSPRVRHAGAIFIGALTPEAIGDYVGGPNHVLPTARSARFSSGLSVLDFLKRTTIARMTPARSGARSRRRAPCAVRGSRGPWLLGDGAARTPERGRSDGRRAREARPPYRGDPRRDRPAAADPRDRAGARVAIFDLLEENRFGLRPARAAPRPPAPTGCSSRSATAGWSSSSRPGPEPGGRVPPLADAVQPGREGLLPDLRELLRRGKRLPPAQIEAIDMGRRGIHDEGRLLLERLSGKVVTDLATARRLFTLICVLHFKG